MAICQPPVHGNKGHLATRTFNFIGVNFNPKRDTITDYVDDQRRNQGARDDMMTFALNAIGDGHNITLNTLFFAAGRLNLGPIEAWDISEASIAATRHIMQKMNIRLSVTLRRIDLFQKTAEDTAFPDVVLSEVLEHLEMPREALLKIHGIMAPGGRLFLNMPCNSPAPDHIYLFDSPLRLFSILLLRRGLCLKRIAFIRRRATRKKGRAKRRSLCLASLLSASPPKQPYFQSGLPFPLRYLVRRFQKH